MQVDNLHEMSDSVSLKNKKNINSLSSAEIQQMTNCWYFSMFLRKQNLTFHAKVSIGDYLHEMSDSVSLKNKKNMNSLSSAELA